MRLGTRDLLGARIDSDHLGEMRCEQHGGLSVAAPEIDRHVAPRRDASHPGEQGGGIPRPKGPVGVRNAREVILEAGHRGSSSRGT
jgi:hypothetical protein